MGKAPLSKLRSLKLPTAKLIIWVLAGSLLAYGATVNAVGNITKRRAPAIALSVVPSDAVALASQAERQFMSSQSRSSLAKVDSLSLRALRQQPLSPAALRLLGYTADLTGNTVTAGKRINLAARVSRRDFGTQLWLIENAVRAGDNKQALVHYDIALRTSLPSRPILFPTLTDALADKQIRDALLPYVRSPPNWMPAFLADAMAGTENPQHVAELLLAAGKSSHRRAFKNIPDLLLNRLATKSQFAAFREYYLSLPDTDRATLESVGLNRKTVGLKHAPAAWQIAEAAALGGSFATTKIKGQYRLDAFVSSGETGSIMQKLLFLKPGSYRLTAQHTALENAADARIEWIIQCLDNQQRAIPITTAASPVKAGGFAVSADFTVTGACEAHMVVLQAAGGSAQGGAEFSVERIDLRRS